MGLLCLLGACKYVLKSWFNVEDLKVGGFPFLHIHAKNQAQLFCFFNIVNKPEMY